MNVELRRVACEDKPVLQNLLQLYLHDYTEFGDDDDVDESGRFNYPYLDLYWTEPERRAFFIRADGKLAGFVLVREGLGDEPHSIAEFFVMRKYRRRGVGRIAAHQVFALFPGRWRVQQSPRNMGAQAFWRQVIGEYTGGRFEEIAKGAHGAPEAVCPPPGQEFEI